MLATPAAAECSAADMQILPLKWAALEHVHMPITVPPANCRGEQVPSSEPPQTRSRVSFGQGGGGRITEFAGDDTQENVKNSPGTAVAWHARLSMNETMLGRPMHDDAVLPCNHVARRTPEALQSITLDQEDGGVVLRALVSTQVLEDTTVPLGTERALRLGDLQLLSLNHDSVALRSGT